MPDMGNGIGSSAFRKQEACDQKGSPSEEIFFSWHGLPLQEIAYIISGLHLDSRTFSQSRYHLPSNEAPRYCTPIVLLYVFSTIMNRKITVHAPVLGLEGLGFETSLL